MTASCAPLTMTAEREAGIRGKGPRADDAGALLAELDAERAAHEVDLDALRDAVSAFDECEEQRAELVAALEDARGLLARVHDHWLSSGEDGPYELENDIDAVLAAARAEGAK